jgi:hypothetical protein
MRKPVAAALCGLTLMAGAATAQTGMDLLDVMKVRIHYDKMPEYEDAVRKLAEVNHKNKGDHWIAYTTEYGDRDTYYFASPRADMAAIETGSAAFENALKEGMGPAGSKLMNDLFADSVSVVAQLRRRRWDLSVHPPGDAAEMLKTVAQSRWIETYQADIKPGKATEFAEGWKPFQAEINKVYPMVSVWASESVTGPSTFYFAIYYKNLAEMDSVRASLATALGSAAYRQLMESLSADAGQGKWEIYRLRPDLSCVPDELAAADPAFWKPKPAMAPPVKSKASTAAKK